MDIDIVKRFIYGAKEAYKKVDNHSYNFPITIESAYRLATNIETLLKEQEAKAIEYHDNSFTGLPVAHCPNCMRFVRQFYASVEEETHYCPWCGQAVMWE